ncbi:diguanylate cyclase (GGDEF)-like protein/PAS domain S-box-containing protein [Actinoalloteichus hoggarensis]|uniref:putative bifunctional diguanylate cyclase/phosphodiesterase n=1 Tax=Actinoalloteichus hoggarensis TaxID=1470176 RepID=UPI00146FA4EB|nr:EAL domain-containing protein [Actinoalloteichus hoggarensis]MBB5924067.1 diguanylate cyclase (GGDEF)-like protein/PAS domain S-box-containing protein [Actinoalloteichus hoggarensis]
MSDELSASLVQETRSVARRDPALAEFAHDWAASVFLTSYVAMTRQDTEDLLSRFAHRLEAALRREPFSPEEGRRIGAAMIGAHFTDSTTLENTLRVLGTRLRPCLSPPPHLSEREVATRLIALSSALAAGYAAALQDHVLRQQEDLKVSMMLERQRSDAMLKESDARFRTAVEGCATGVATLDVRARVQTANSALAELFATGGSELVGRDILTMVHPEDLPSAAEHLTALSAGECDRFRSAMRFLIDGEQPVWTRVTGSLIRDKQGMPDQIVMFVEDCTQSFLNQEMVRRQLMVDPLTGLANRSVLVSQMEAVLGSLRPDGRLALCYFGLDGFRLINDGLGYDVGDEVLRKVAGRLAAEVASTGELVARISADEFVVLIPDTRGTAPVVERVEVLLAALTEPMRVCDRDVSVSVSVGVVERSAAEVGPLELIRAGDLTLRAAKDDGRAQWALYDPDRDQIGHRRSRLAATMPAALRAHEFYLDFQPVMRLADGRLTSVRAVARWDHSEFGLLSQDDFVGLAAEAGQVVDYGRWLLRQACEQAQRWRRGLGSTPTVSVALVDRQVRDQDLVRDVRTILDETGLPPASLRLEVPAVAAFTDTGEPLDTWSILAELGVRLVVGELGSMGRLLSRLRLLPVEAVLVSGVPARDPNEGSDAVDQFALRSMVAMFRRLGPAVIASDVDDAAQARRLRTMGCELAYGEFFGPPSDPMGIEELVAAGSLVRGTER